MKFYIPTREERIRRYKNPHLWFAWHPVRIGNSGEYIWLEYVVRSYPYTYETDDGLHWEEAQYESLDEWLWRNPNKML